MTPTIDADARLTMLEGSYRRLRRLATVLAIGCAIAVALAVSALIIRPGGRTLTTERLVLVDPQGRTMAVLGADDSWPLEQYRRIDPEFRPTHGLYLRDGTGRPLLGLFATSAGAAHCDFLDGDGRVRMTLIKSPDNQTLLACNNASATTTLLLGTGKQGKPGLILRGDGLVGLNDAAGITRIGMGVEGGQGALVIQDAKGEVIRRVP